MRGIISAEFRLIFQLQLHHLGVVDRSGSSLFILGAGKDFASWDDFHLRFNGVSGLFLVLPGDLDV
jgi:hypothetical protein